MVCRVAGQETINADPDGGAAPDPARGAMPRRSRWSSDQANLTGASLRGANLTGAVLFEATLSGAYLNEETLIEAADLTDEQVNSAHGESKTRLPGSITRPEAWASPAE
ncbi:pentapeptide repeat-containing protein [Actinomycetospora lutea]|uniref:pentapeptide repeat-containing protein n=1 Tax=Actinomycetospora lutea TaxID=663604 RepID=UPI003B67D1DC